MIVKYSLETSIPSGSMLRGGLVMPFVEESSFLLHFVGSSDEMRLCNFSCFDTVVDELYTFSKKVMSSWSFCFNDAYKPLLHSAKMPASFFSPV